MTATAAPAAPTTPVAPVAQPAAPATAPKTAPGVGPGDASKILNASDTDFGQMFGIDAILAGKPFEHSPAAAALDGAAASGEGEGAGAATASAPEETTTDDIPRGADGEPLPAYREDSKGNLHAPDGKFVPKEGKSEAARPDAGAADAEGEGGEVATDPANPDAAATPAEPVKLATDFNLLDAENQEIEYPSDLKIKFTANGKEVELPLDRTVRLAKMGFYNEEKEQRFESIEQRNQKLEPFAREILAESQQLQKHLDRILAGDDDFLAKAREFYVKETSPEAENERLRARIHQLESAPPRTGDPSANAPQQAAAAVAPVIADLIESNKDVVPEAEVWSHVGKLVAPYRNKAGQLDPARLRDVVAVIQGALKLTVESLAETRRLAAKTTADANTAKQVARGKVLELKRKVTTAAKPQGQRPGVTQSTPTPAAQPRANPSAEDTIEAALQGAVGRMRAG